MFSVFTGSRPEDVHAFYDWAAWIATLVEARDDPILRQRYERLRLTLPPRGTAPVTATAARARSLRTNRDAPLIDALFERLPRDVLELHVTAPFFDKEARALRELLTRVQPTQELHVYLCARASVDSPALATTLAAASSRVFIHRFEPRQFVHAKLVGVIGGNGRGVLMSGSANLSQAALLRTYTTAASAANCEAAVLSIADNDKVRAAFDPPGVDTPVVDLAEVDDIEYRDDDERYPAFPLRLLSAALEADRRVSVRLDGDFAEQTHLASDVGSAPLPLGDDQLTAPVPDDADPLIVWLEDAGGKAISNHVVLDEPRALEAILGEKRGGNRPNELLEDSEDTELVALLAWAHRRFIFDIEDTDAARRASNAQEKQADATDDDFWERYAREELSYDDRSIAYRRLGAYRLLTDDDLLLREIEAMLRAAPRDRQLRLVREAAGGGATDSPRAGNQWSPNARQQLRALNLLQRWARALNDPRHAWTAPTAPAQNYEALLEVLCLLWLGDAMDAASIIDLLGEVWTSFLGSASKRGVVDRLDADLATEAIEAVASQARALAAGLAGASLADGHGWKTFVYDWQWFLVRAAELELFTFDEFAVDVADALGAAVTAPSALEELLLERAFYVDDETWGLRVAEELGLTRVAIIPHAAFKGVSLAVTVAGLSDPSRDPRLITLARRALSFKRVDDVLLDANGQRFLLRLGVPVVARVDGALRESVVPLDRDRLAAVDEQAGTLAELLGIAG